MAEVVVDRAPPSRPPGAGALEAAAAHLSLGAIAIAAAVVVVLLALADGYGWHRDELYFVAAGRHPAFGYVDQPALTPILAALGATILGPTPLAVRILPAIAAGLAIVLTADMARRFGGSTRSQLIAAATLAASGFLFAGHLASTTTFDLLIWTLVTWLVIRLLAGADPRLWLAVGALGGLGFENKHTVVLLAAGLTGGLLLSRRWALLRSPPLWLGALVAVALAAPNVLWQASRDWPALDMARAIARGNAGGATVVVELWLLAGSFVVFVPVTGLLWLLTRREARPWQPLGWAAIIVLVIVVLADGKSYYAMGILPALTAAGAVVVARWSARGRTPLRPALVATAAAVSITIMALATLPIVPAGSLAATPIPDLNREQGEQIGWPELVAAVRDAVETLPAADRDAAVILTSNYGEAGAIALLAPELPPAYSGHNAYWDWGPPPDGRSAAVLVGPSSFQAAGVGACSLAGRIANDAGVRNQEWGYQVRVCRSVPASFADLWSMYRHLD